MLQVPLAQKWLIQKARLAARPVMVAGQLMEGMAVSPRPSRPEITDIVNAVYDGADAVVLMQVGCCPYVCKPVESSQMHCYVSFPLHSSCAQRAFEFICIHSRTTDEGMAVRPRPSRPEITDFMNTLYALQIQ